MGLSLYTQLVSSAQVGVENGRRLFAPKSTCEIIIIQLCIWVKCECMYLHERECVYALVN